MTFDQRRIYLMGVGLIGTLASGWYTITDFSLLPLLGLISGHSLTYLGASGQGLRRRDGDLSDPRSDSK
jgi:hypothetical protein